MPEDVPQEVAEHTIIRTTETLRLVVQGLILVAALSIISVAILAYQKRQAPAELIGIGSAAVGALSTLLARVGKVNGNG